MVDCAADTDSQGSSSVITLWSINMLMHTLPHQTIAFLAPYVISTYRFLTSTKTYEFTLLVPSLPFTNTNTMPRLFFFFFFCSYPQKQSRRISAWLCSRGKVAYFSFTIFLSRIPAGLRPAAVKYQVQAACGCLGRCRFKQAHTHTHSKTAQHI